jgi:hypothetical protein
LKKEITTGILKLIWAPLLAKTVESNCVPAELSGLNPALLPNKQNEVNSPTDFLCPIV